MNFRQHVKTWGKEEDFSRRDWKLASLSSAWLTNDTDNISSSELRMNFSKTLETLVVVDITHNLQFFTLTLQIVENKIFSLCSDVCNSACNRCLFFEEIAYLAQGIVLFDKIWYTDSDIELVGIWICLWGFFQFFDHVWSVLIILSGVENNFFLLLLFLLELWFGFLFGLFLSFLSSKTFLLFESFLFIFAQLALAFSFLTLSCLVFNLSGRLLKNRLLLLIWIVFHQWYKRK